LLAKRVFFRPLAAAFSFPFNKEKPSVVTAAASLFTAGDPMTTITPNPTYTDASIDLETLGKHHYAAVISIGIVAFNRHTGDMDEGLNIVLNVEDVVKHGAQMDASTVIWWMQQSDAARKVFTPGGGVSVDYALKMVDNYFRDNNLGKNAGVWGNGPKFDVGLLEDLYRMAGKKEPWAYWQARDVRTVVDIANLDKAAYRKKGTHHNAVDDARNQAQMVIDSIAALRRDA
jgi:hypothetical protein